MNRKLHVGVITAAIAASVHAMVIAGVDVRSEFDKAFDFKRVQTRSWNPQGRGDVRMARTQDDDPEAMRKRAEPIIVEAVTAELTKRGLREAAEPSDVFVTYYLLLSTGVSEQTVGQFLPATTMWAIPPFAPATQSLSVMDRGSLVIDFSARQQVVWRGVAQAKIKVDADAARRESLLRESVRDLLRKFPPR